jgi:NAD(P)-dependent dehydrogenase (short-subunit alcohol dehydrogenase family)
MTIHRVETPFSADATAEEVVDGLHLGGRRAIVTGGASGIGQETARALAAAGAAVTLAVRNQEAGQRAAEQITSSTGNQHVAVSRLELADPASVRAFTDRWQDPLHILVNNAGVMALPELTTTPEGWELQFATNHLGHFGLALGLHDALAAAGDARIVSVSSAAHRLSPVVFGDIHFRNRPYDPWSAYGQSKTANVLFAVEASRRWAPDGITANAVMPGSIRTNLQRHVPGIEDNLPADYPWKTIPQGASTSVLLAASPLVQGIGGRYFEDNAEAVITENPVGPGVRPFAVDPEAALRLWELSIQMLSR